MASDRPLSKKKITQQTISISPALKDRIEQYVIENHKKYPNDNGFKNISAFYNYVMEKTMDCFEQGKTIDDFEAFVDSEIKEFFEKNTEQEQMLIEYLSQQAEITQNNGIFYLN